MPFCLLFSDCFNSSSLFLSSSLVLFLCDLWTLISTVFAFLLIYFLCICCRILVLVCHGVYVQSLQEQSLSFPQPSCSFRCKLCLFLKPDVVESSQCRLHSLGSLMGSASLLLRRTFMVVISHYLCMATPTVRVLIRPHLCPSYPSQCVSFSLYLQLQKTCSASLQVF